MNREKRVLLAQETLAICQQGYYVNRLGEQVIIKSALQQTIDNTKLYRPMDFVEIHWLEAIESKTIIEVTTETTLAAAQRLVKAGHKTLCLNFASAKNAGGGFLNGSQAQEESLARSSGLYLSLISQEEMYFYNRGQKSCFYSDYMIYSPAVPVFRADNGALLDDYYVTSFITSPAVNAGVIRQREPERVEEIYQIMSQRLEKVLWVAYENRYTSLVLGAWGCGVFANDPNMISKIFAELLGKQSRLATYFKHITYAIYDSSVNQKVYKSFVGLSE